jgi:transposase
MLLFPNIAQKPHSPHEKPLERTLAIIRPSALKIYKGLKKYKQNKILRKFSIFRCYY